MASSKICFYFCIWLYCFCNLSFDFAQVVVAKDIRNIFGFIYTPTNTHFGLHLSDAGIFVVVLLGQIIHDSDSLNITLLMKELQYEYVEFHKILCFDKDNNEKSSLLVFPKMYSTLLKYLCSIWSYHIIFNVLSFDTTFIFVMFEKFRLAI